MIDSPRESQGTGKTHKYMSAQKSNLKSIEQQIRDLGKHEHEHSFSEAFIHQCIETIEFVLGTVSNTASYLRLWALSLAHSQLSEVFFKLIFEHTLKQHSSGMTIAVGLALWPMFWSISFAVLMLMDLLECILHTLRLHWVEF